MKILIVEDEIKTAKLLQEFILHQDKNNTVLAILESVQDTVQFLEKKQTPDLIFMDVHLSDGQCFDIFKKIEVDCPVVFCTAYDQYTLDAFQTNGVAYIMKPFREEDIQTALEKVTRLFPDLDKTRTVVEEQPSAPKAYKQTLLVHFRETILPISIHQIALFSLEDNLLHLYLQNGKRYTVSKTLDQLQSEFDPQQFYRINRQMLVNRAAIRKIEPYFNRKMILELSFNYPEKAIISRLKVTPFLNWMEVG